MHEGGDDLDYGFPLQSAGTLRSKLKGLDDHIRAFSVRNLSYDQDSLTAFLGIAEKYSSYNGLRLFLGIPVWIGNMSNGHGRLLHICLVHCVLISSKRQPDR